jgi:hypothetical protein
MPKGDKTKEPTFKLWLAGKPLEDIQEEIVRTSKTRASSVAGWVRDWERGKQEVWDAEPQVFLFGPSVRKRSIPASINLYDLSRHGELTGFGNADDVQVRLHRCHLWVSRSALAAWMWPDGEPPQTNATQH